MQIFNKHKKIVLVVFLISALLLATHKGEFWPFSIFPMFSTAGQPWSRALVEEVRDTTRSDLWEVKPLQSIENRVLSLDKYGVYEIDFANYMNKTQNWDQNKINGLRSTLQINNHPDKMWMATKVTGKLSSSDSITVQTVPLILFTADTTILNPLLFQNKSQ